MNYIIPIYKWRHCLYFEKWRPCCCCCVCMYTVFSNYGPLCYCPTTFE